jgi:hypothetical protein
MECVTHIKRPQKKLALLMSAVLHMVKKGPNQPSSAQSGGGGEAYDDEGDVGSSAPTHAQLAENLTRVGSQDAMVQNEALVGLHIFISTVYTQGGGPSLPHSDILQAVVPLLSHANISLATHVVIAQILRTVADNAGEDVCDALAASVAIPSVLANLEKALASPSPDVCALCSDYFFFLASLCDCRQAYPLRVIASQWPVFLSLHLQF